jgi:hypothetical protein
MWLVPDTMTRSKNLYNAIQTITIATTTSITTTGLILPTS